MPSSLIPAVNGGPSAGFVEQHHAPPLLLPRERLRLLNLPRAGADNKVETPAWSRIRAGKRRFGRDYRPCQW